MQKALEGKGKTKNSQFTPVNRVGLEKQKIYEVMFLQNDEDQSVDVVESATIDFNAIIEHLGEGNSIFIAQKIQGTPIKNRCKGHSYINHIQVLEMDNMSNERKGQRLDRRVILEEKNVNPLAVLISLPLAGMQYRISNKTKRRQRSLYRQHSSS